MQACTIEVVDFDPRGTDVALVASWTIDNAPADLASCAAAGIETVELVFLRGSIEYHYPEFSFDCAAGSYSGAGDLQKGTYSVFWEAQDAAGKCRSSQPRCWSVDANGDVARPGIPDFGTFDPRGTDVDL